MSLFKVAVVSLIVAAPFVARAEMVCGHLDKREVGPQCIPGRPCPQYRMIQYYITADGKETVLMSPVEDTLNKIAELANTEANKRICAEGFRNEKGELYVQDIFVDEPNRN